MEPASRPRFNPAGAGGLLIGTLVAAMGIGALIGWGAGSARHGLLVGAIVGIPAGVFAVYRRYREAFS